MKKRLIFTLFIIIFCLIIMQSNILESLLLFWLVGAVPGTTLSLSPAIMMTIMFAIGWLVAFKFVISTVLLRYQKHAAKKKHAERKKRMPNRRFSEI